MINIYIQTWQPFTILSDCTIKKSTHQTVCLEMQCNFFKPPSFLYCKNIFTRKLVLYPQSSTNVHSSHKMFCAQTRGGL